MKNRIRIAYITKNLRINGISAVLMNYSKELDKKKYEVTIFSGLPISEVHKKTCDDYGIKLIETPQKKNFIKYYLIFFKNISKKKYDIVHFHCNSASITPELLIVALKGIKIRIAHSHNTTCDHRFAHFLMKPIMNRMLTYRFACGKEAGKWLYGKQKKFDVINNGFDTEKYRFNSKSRQETRKKLGYKDEIVIGHVGRFNELKNHDFLLDVFEQLIKKDDRYRLLLIGNGPNYEHIKERINKEDCTDKIIMYGETNNVKELYDAMDLFVLPSKHEGLVVVLLEAQINGLNCLVSDSVSNEGFINDTSVRTLSLAEPIEKWVNEIRNTKYHTETQRGSFIENNTTNVNRYEIKNNVSSLENKYNELYSNYIEK